MARALLTTPAGEGRWAKVFEPEENRLDPTKPRTWGIELALPAESKECLALVQTIEGELARIHGAGAKVSDKGWPFKEDVDHETGQSTGKLLFRFKKNETTQRGKTLSPPLVYDSRKNPWPADTLIGNGSTVKVAFSCWGWENQIRQKGVSLWLDAVQVLDLVPYERVSAADAFGVENGYVVETPAAAFPAAEPAAAQPMSMSERLRQRSMQVAAEAQAIEEEIPF